MCLDVCKKRKHVAVHVECNNEALPIPRDYCGVDNAVIRGGHVRYVGDGPSQQSIDVVGELVSGWSLLAVADG